VYPDIGAPATTGAPVLGTFLYGPSCDRTTVPEAFTDAGEWVRQSARGGASGVPLAEDWWFAFGFRGARIAKMSMYSQEAEALEAVGLSDQPPRSTLQSIG
jgi:hypothetical protein